MAAEVIEQRVTEHDRRLKDHDDHFERTDEAIRDGELWRARMEGSIDTIKVMVGFGLGLPAAAVAVYSLVTFVK